MGLMEISNEDSFAQVAAALAYFGGIESEHELIEIIKKMNSEEIAERVRKKYLEYMRFAEGGGGRADCKWMVDEVCVNATCPMCADFCPVAEVKGVCRFEVSEGG